MSNTSTSAPRSWVPGANNGDFTLANLPFGIINHVESPRPHVGVAVGDWVLDMQQMTKLKGARDLLDFVDHHVFSEITLNAFASLGRALHRRLRGLLQDLLSVTTSSPDFLSTTLSGSDATMVARWRLQALYPRDRCRMHLPMQIGDYTDFYAGYHHAYRVGVMFRGPDKALQPNYTHLPVGYHGRSSSIVVSGVPIRRPLGQVLEGDSAEPSTGPSKKLDFEVELGCLIGTPNAMGERISIENAEDHIFGYVLLNDWSARDIQRWEYVPLGPFNGKNFATTISPWVVLADALDEARVAAIENKTPLQPYLKEQREDRVFDIELSVQRDGREISVVSSRNLIWSFPQMIAHHTLGGCPMRTGDLLGSGTISGLGDGEKGSLLEMAGDNKSAPFLQDGETIVMRGVCHGKGIGFGDCAGRIEAPAP